MFLDLTVTDSVSFPAMPALLEPGATYDGWRYATRSEVAALLNAIGWSPPITDLSFPNLSSTSIARTVLEDFIGVITDTSVPPNTIDIQSAGFLADGDGVSVSYFDNIVQFSTAARRRHLELKRFLRARVYRHHRVYRMSVKAGRIVEELFNAFMEDPRLMPDENFARASAQENRERTARARAVADYIAGMTDRFAIAEHQRVFDPPTLP